MKRCLLWLLQPAPLTLLGVLLLSLVLWFEGPLLAFDGKAPFASSAVRGWLIAILFLLWAGYFLYQFARARLAGARLAAGVAGQAAAPGAAEADAELALLGERLRKALEVLRGGTRGRRGSYLYQLPWYMFVGAPGSGKTTALVHSGLQFPLADSLGKNAIGGIGGTRNCDWWFTDEAVLLDTAGRYTTQDSHAEADQAAWRGFLQLLRKQRRRRPLNGVIVAVSVADLLLQGEAARKQQALAVRARVKDLREQLGLRFPVYVMLTKCDLLAGFTEFFDDMGKEERSQVWGVTLPLAMATEAALAGLPAELAALERQLQARLLERLQRERDLPRRALIYSFPQQFSGLAELLCGFLGDAFAPTRYEEPALLRGVYFTSGTQEGNPIDRVMNAMAAAFGLPRQVLPAGASGGRSYFITRLLREVIFAEAEVAGVNLALERRRRLLQWGAMGATALLLVLGVAGLLTSYARNGRLVEQAGVQAAALVPLTRQAGAGPLQSLPLLNALHVLPAGYAERERAVPLLMTFGLYQGDKLGAGAQAAYQRALRAQLLQHIAQRMEQQLRRGNANPPDYLYETLRAYLMLGDGRRFEPEAVVTWIEVDWQRSLAGASTAQREQLSAHAQALLGAYRSAELPRQLDAALVAETRLALARMPLQQRLYNSVKQEMTRLALPEFNAAAAGGRDAPQVLARRSGEALTRGVPGMFSPAGYASFRTLAASALEDLNRDSWVLARQEATGAGGDAGQVQAALTQLYFNDYIGAWDRWLDDLTVAPFTTLDQGVRISMLLGGAESPLRKLLLAAARDTTLEGGAEAKPDASLATTVKSKGDSYKKKLEGMLGMGGGEAPAVPKPRNPVDAHFEALHKLVAGAPAPLDGMLAMLKDVAAYMDAAAAAKRAGAPPPPADALTRLKREADGKPAPLAQLMQNLDRGGSGLTMGSERERLNALWTARAGPFCRQAIAGRYPLARGAAQEVTPDDFGKFFGPGGLVDEFFQQNLAAYVETGGRQWRWRPNADKVTLGIAQDVLDSFQRAAQVRDAYFSGGGRQASMRFELRLLGADPAWSQVLFDIDGQVVPFGPPASVRAASLQLPSGKGGGEVRLETTPAGARTLRTDGGWAWLRMIDLGTLEPTAQAERYKLSFDIDNRRVSYSLTASSVINPFRREALEQFRCMDRL